MRIEIIIPVNNRKENIEKTLICLSRQVINQDNHVFLTVVDHGSTDGTGEVIERTLTDYFPFDSGIIAEKFTIPRDKWSASIPRNYGVKQAQYDVDGYLFLDSDILLPPNRIQRLIDDWETDPDPMRVIIGAYHYLQQPLTINNPEWYMGEIKNYAQDVRWQSFLDHPVQEKNTGIGFALSTFGGNLFIPRDLFFNVNMFDENCVAGVEDGSMGLSLLKAGARFSLDKELLGWHNCHVINPDRTENIEEMKKYINLKHFGTENPNYGILEATREAYGSWGFNWHDPKWEEKKDATS